jgi:predicted RNA binding protein YcfA (HicA-like mRNA interferase family)
MYRKIPSMSSRKFMRLLGKGGATFVRQRATDHTIFERIVNGRRYAAPVLSGKRTLDPNYCKRVLRQLKFSDEEIDELLKD